MFEAASSTTETPDPEGVDEAFVKLIETPAGKRPFRTVPTAAIQPLLENYNALAATMRDTVSQIFQVPELTVLQQAGPEACKEGSARCGRRVDQMPPTLPAVPRA